MTTNARRSRPCCGCYRRRPSTPLALAVAVVTARERLAAVDAALDALAWDLAFTSAGGIVVEIRDRLDRIGRIVYDLEPWDNNVDDRGAPARRCHGVQTDWGLRPPAPTTSPEPSTATTRAAAARTGRPTAAADETAAARGPARRRLDRAANGSDWTAGRPTVRAGRLAATIYPRCAGVRRS